MWTALRVAATGAVAQQRALDVSANNLANVNTVGFKVRRAALVDMPPGKATFTTSGTPGEDPLGEGVVLGGVLPNFGFGQPIATGQPLDVAIVGDGFLQVQLPDGSAAYTRDGALKVDGNGRLHLNGNPLQPAVTIPPNAREIYIESDGRITGLANATGTERSTLGQITLARFPNPDGLRLLGGNLFAASENSGPAATGAPGAGGLGALQSGALEGANVDIADQMVNVMLAQRAYSVNLRALRIIDEMLQTANGMRR